MGGAEGLAELRDWWSWGMAELGDGWSAGGFLFFIPMVYFLRFNSILLCAAIMVKKKIFASYLTVASRAY